MVASSNDACMRGDLQPDDNTAHESEKESELQALLREANELRARLAQVECRQRALEEAAQAQSTPSDCDGSDSEGNEAAPALQLNYEQRLGRGCISEAERGSGVSTAASVASVSGGNREPGHRRCVGAVGEELRLEPNVSAMGLFPSEPLIDKHRLDAAMAVVRCLSGGNSGFLFDVQPALPEGLVLNPITGVISGTPVDALEDTQYSVTVHCSATVDVSLAVLPEVLPHLSHEVDPKAAETAENIEVEINADFATRLDAVQNLADLDQIRPSRFLAFGDWMIWMVHRAWLNDPTLVDFDFSNAQMPPAHIEHRIAPKLMAAMSWNTHIEVLNLANSNLQRSQGIELASALERNCTLRHLNIESNSLDSGAVRAIALAIRDNKDTRLESLLVAHQKQVGKFFGRPTEEALGLLMQSNGSIVKISLECDDAHWRNSIDRGLLRNQDNSRRGRRTSQLSSSSGEPASGGEAVSAASPIEERSLGQLLLCGGLLANQLTSVRGDCSASSPQASGSDDEKSLKPRNVLHEYVIQNLRLPSSEQLRNFAKNAGAATLPYSEVAPLLKDCRAILLEAALDSEVIVTDVFGTPTSGALRRWEEGGQLQLEVMTSGGQKFTFRCYTREPVICVSEAWAEWLLQQP